MISVLSLWLPILLSAVFVFVISSIIHMLLAYHRNDFVQVPSEDQVMDALRPFNIPPGNYSIPRAGNMKEMNAPEFQEKMTKGPVAMMTVLPNGPYKMGKSLVLWFLYAVLVGIFAAYIAGRALGPGAYYLEVFRFVGSTALGVNLVQPQLGRYLQVDVRRFDLRAGDRRCVRLALAILTDVPACRRIAGRLRLETNDLTGPRPAVYTVCVLGIFAHN